MAQGTLLGGISRQSAFRFVLFDAAAAGVSLIITYSLARFLVPEEYGILAYGLMLGQVAMEISSFGQGKSLVRNIIQAQDPHAIFSASIAVRGQLAAGVGLLLLAWVLLTGDKIEQIYSIGISLLWSLFMAVTPQPWLDAHGRMDQQALINFLDRCCYGLLIFLCIIVLNLPRTAILIASCLFIVRMTNLAFLWRQTFSDFKPFRPGWTKFIRGYLSQSHFIWYASLGNLMMTHASQIILENRTNMEELGYYSFSLQLIWFVRLFQGQFLRILTPGIAKATSLTETLGSIDEIKRAFFKCIGLSALFSVAMGMLLMWIGPFVINNFIPDYEGAIPGLYVLIVWSIVYGPAIVNNQFLLGLHLDRLFVYITILSGILSVFIAWWLTSLYGSLGAAIALLFAHMASILAQVSLVWRKFGQLEQSIKGAG